MELPFVDPYKLVALLALPVLAALLKMGLRIRRERLGALGAPITSNRSMVLLPLMVATCLALSIARPYLGFEDLQIPRLGKDIIAVVDVSYSMLATDASPNRMEFAKRKLHDLIELLQKGGDGDRLGIVLFAGESYLFCPLTEDYAVLRTFANSISVGLIASGGSAITQALVTAAKSFQTTKAQLPAVLLLSDGEDSELVVARSLDILRGFKLSLWALGFGGGEGKPLTLPGGRLLRDSKGNIVVSKLNEAGLQELAAKSGGSYSRASLDESDLRTILAQFRTSIKTEVGESKSGSLRIYNEFGAVLLWIPLALLTLLRFQGRQRLILSLAGFFCLLPAVAITEEPVISASPAPLSAYEAQRAFEAGDFELAERAFRELLKTSPEDNRILRALAASEFRQGKYDSAQKHYSELAARAQLGRDKFHALYDAGTTEIMNRRYQDAVEHFEEALRIKPADEAAVHNLEVARKLLEQQKQPPPSPSARPSPTPESQQEKSEDRDQKEPAPSPAASPETPSAPSPSPQPGAEQQQSESPPSPSEPAEGDSTPSPTPAPKETASPSPPPSPIGTPAEEGDGTPEGDNSTPSAKPEASPPSAASQQDPRSLEEREAQAWLESLDDSPVLLRRQVGNKRSAQQQSW